ncbi:MAG: UDP-N-acetylmuramoyl-tripeptide--D-alanyl-D-alanine ligase, partial [Ectothiorhodospiraceae bacterium]|nr:UDP-N-acetylmuramoyl-tripeptide--D-alanyl-D-alanine ligase [Ectothiorhodospiraceae bacterium]
MIRARLAQVLPVLGAGLQGEDAEFRGVALDSRRIEVGNLFVALTGPRFDGHDYAAAALAAGASAVLVERPVEEAEPALLVDDARQALGRLGRWWRLQQSCSVVGITGSNGKTTVKQMLQSILEQVAPTYATQGNLNNELGVPLTLSRIGSEHRYAVVEMGASAAGEIAYLAGLAEPDVAVVTNAGPAHLQGFGSLDGVDRAKGELFRALGPGAAAVINVDDTYADLWRGYAAGRRIVGFGFSKDADVRGSETVRGDVFEVETPLGPLHVRLPVAGRHNRMNALAAIAVAVTLGVEPDRIRLGLERFRPAGGRLQRVTAKGGGWLIDDSYNANPASLSAGLAVLLEQPGEPWLVLGDMGELGAEGEEMHA